MTTPEEAYAEGRKDEREELLSDHPGETVAVEVDQDAARDLSIIANMLARANREHLLIEVVAAFGEYRGGGDSVADAAFCALSDWDV